MRIGCESEYDITAVVARNFRASYVNRVLFGWLPYHPSFIPSSIESGWKAGTSYPSFVVSGLRVSRRTKFFVMFLVMAPSVVTCIPTETQMDRTQLDPSVLIVFSPSGIMLIPCFEIPSIDKTKIATYWCLYTSIDFGQLPITRKGSCSSRGKKLKTMPITIWFRGDRCIFPLNDAVLPSFLFKKLITRQG